MDKIKKYVINLDRRPDKYEYFKQNCPYNDVERISAFDGNNPSSNKNLKEFNILRENITKLKPGEYGCFISHLLLWERIVKENHEYALIFEDDPIFCENFKEKCDKLSENIHLIDTILYIGGRFIPNFIPDNRIEITDNIYKSDYSKGVNQEQDCRGTFCYLITKRCCEFFLSIRPGREGDLLNKQKTPFPLDHYMLTVLLRNKFNIFHSKPLLCYSLPNDPTSDVR